MCIRDSLNPRPGETIIDMAGGTGDLARRFKALADKAMQRRGGEPARIIAVSYTHLDVYQRQALKLALLCLKPNKNAPIFQLLKRAPTFM